MAHLRFAFSEDIHLVLGQSIHIGQLLFKDPRDTRVTFRPLFAGNRTSGDFYTNSLIEVDTATGQVNTYPNPPGPHPVRNFLLITEETSGPGQAVIRIHVHNSIQTAFLSPDPLTVPKNTDNYQFTVWVQYDDGVYANITRSDFDSDPAIDPETGPGIDHYYSERWVNHVTPPYHILWEAATAPGTDLIDPVRGTISPSDAILFREQTINFTLGIQGIMEPRRFENAGQILISDPLSEIARGSRAELINCRFVQAGPQRRNEAINVMFVADGFTADQSSVFENITDDIVDQLTSKKILTPFNMLEGKINFWRTFFPSRESGVSHFCEFFLLDRGRKPLCKISFPKFSEVDNIQDWQLENLLWHVGLPTPEEFDLSVAELKQRWAETTLLDALDTARISDELIEDWKQLCNRRPLFDRDTFWGRQISDAPCAQPDSDFNRIGGTAKRLDINMEGGLWEHVADRNGHPVGELFSPPVMGDNIRGKDLNRVIIVSPALGVGDYNTDKCIPLGRPSKRFTFNGSLEDFANRTAYIWPESAYQLQRHHVATLAYQLGLSLGLSTEHGLIPQHPDWCSRFHFEESVDNWTSTRLIVGATPSHSSADRNSGLYDDSGNLAARADLFDNEGHFFSNLIRWNYHRIEKCIRLSEAPRSLGGNRYECNYILSETTPTTDQVVANTETVFLRRRQNTQPVCDIIRTGGYVPLVAGPFQVENVNTSSQQITISGTAPSGASGGHTVDIMDLMTDAYDDGEAVTILYKPVYDEAHAAAEDDDFAKMLSVRVREHLESRPYPVNARQIEADGFYDEIIDCSSQQNTDGLPDALVPSCSKRKPEMIALYSGGSGVHCHIYHPTARCLMRQPQRSNSISGAPNTLREFCAVCRYVIVDMVDPTRHPELDRIYRRRKINPDEA